MKKINLTIKKTFLKFLFYSFLLSIISIFILIHFGDIQFKGENWSYRYINNILDIRTFTGVYDFPFEYSEKLKIYLKILYTGDGIIRIVYGTFIYLILMYIIKFVRIKVE